MGIADIRVEDLARHLGLAPEDLRAALPENIPAKKIPGLYLYAEGVCVPGFGGGGAVSGAAGVGEQG